MKKYNQLLKEVTKLNDNNEYKKAIELLPDSVLEEYKNAALYAEKAMSLWSIQQYDECELMANMAIELDKENAKGWHYIGNYNIQFKNYKKAKVAYLKAIQFEPKYTYPHHGLGIVYYNFNDYNKAKEAFLKSIELDIKYAYPYNSLGNVYSNSNDYDKAKEAYSKAIKLDSKYASPYNGLGNLYSNLKEYDKAKKAYLKAIRLDSKHYFAFYNLARLYFNQEFYDKAKDYYYKYLELEKDKDNIHYKTAISRIREIEKIEDNLSYKEVYEIISDIKELLKYSGNSISHYTGISTVQFLILNESPFRLSEGSFLNDTSEGQELFTFLDFTIQNGINVKYNKENFAKRPFIGSFVDSEKDNDLTLWRMYGKEALEEAKGCSITLNAQELKQEIKKKINSNENASTTNIDDIEFYRVAYRNGNEFDFAGSTTKQKKELNKLMQNLNNKMDEFKASDDKNQNQEKEIVELLNQIAYLFKSVEYQYENEIRLIIKEAIGFERKIDFKKENFNPSINPNKVYIELVPVFNLLKTITIGPKVDKGEEWASTFYYSLANRKLYPEIQVSTLPFK